MSDDGYNQLFAHLAGGKRLRAQSVEQTPESREMQVVAAVTTGSLRGLESEILRVATALDHNAQTREAIVGEWLALDGFQNRVQLEAAALRISAEILRRHVAATSERQPEENTAVRRAADGSNTQSGV
jgi:hypothetical protein